MGDARGHFEEEEDAESETVDDRKLLSRYGIWLMVELCKVKDDISVVCLLIQRLYGIVFE